MPVCGGVRPNGFGLWGIAEASKGFGKIPGSATRPTPKTLSAVKNPTLFSTLRKVQMFYPSKPRWNTSQQAVHQSPRIGKEKRSKSSCFGTETPASNCLYQLLRNKYENADMRR